MKSLLLPSCLVLLVLAVAQVRACPSYWTRNGNSCYRFIGLPQTYDRAESVCKMFTGCGSSQQAQGLGHMVSINSAEENQFVFSFMASNFGEMPPPPIWLGLSDNNAQQTYTWSDGTVPGPTTFSAWRRDSPQQPENRNCATFSELLVPRWMEMFCTEELTYICEVPATTMDSCGQAGDPANPASTTPAPFVRGPNQPPIFRYNPKYNMA